MTKPEADETPAQTEAVAEAEAPPAPEPWTPERVLEWNRYYDLYVVAAVLVVVFLAGAHKISNSAIWTHLEAGRLAIRQAWPVVTDPFAYADDGTASNRTWVNVSWLFEVAHAALYDFGHGLIAKKNATPETLQRADQVAAGLMVGVSCLVRLLTALVLINIRRRGPGLWWTAICAALALGGMITPMPFGGQMPLTITQGGVAGPGDVEPGGWGMLLLALELAILFAAEARNRPRALFALPVLFAIWANVDESFLVGLIVLAAQVVGGLVRRPAEGPAESPGRALAVLGLSAAAAMLNPSLYLVYPAALNSLTDLVTGRAADLTFDQLSFFGAESQKYFDRIADMPGAYRYFIAYYLVVVAAVWASFALNWRRFRLGRFLMVVAVTILWGLLRQYGSEFAVVGAVAVALNGQEWYQDRFGNHGRLGTGWALWSTGGRAVTILALFLLVVRTLTGYGTTAADFQVGFGVNPFEFAFEAADYLKDAPIKGNVLNLNLSHGDALIWRAWPTNKRRKTYIDSRKHVFNPDRRRELKSLRDAFRDGDASAWSPVLDRLGATVVMLTIVGDRAIYEAMARSPDWYEFYDDGKVVLFGRGDETELTKPDLAYFKDHRLDADLMVYKQPDRVPSTIQPPTPVSWLDRYFRARAMETAQPHVLAADRWLGARWNVADIVPDPAHCIMAIRQARTALSYNPSDTYAFRILNRAYQFLTLSESAVLAQSPNGVPNDYLMFRFRQRVTALNYAILTTAPPTTTGDKAELGVLHLDLADMFRSVGYLDLERDHLEQAQRLIPADEFPGERADRLAQLDEAVEQIQLQLDDLAAQQPNPLQVAEAAIGQGLIGAAIRRLEEAEEQGVSMAAVKSRLVDLYCQTGLPDRSFEVAPNIEDPSLNTGPGTPAYRQGLVSLLLGDYGNATSLWRDRALPQLQGAEAAQSLQAARGLIRGELKPAASNFLEIPSLARDQAVWEMQLGLCLLEGGNPEGAAEHLAQSLRLRPNQPARALLVDYLKKMGQPVPEAEAESEEKAEPKPGGGSTPEPTPAGPTPTTPAPAPKPAAELPADVFAPPADGAGKP